MFIIHTNIIIKNRYFLEVLKSIIYVSFNNNISLISYLKSESNMIYLLNNTKKIKTIRISLMKY